MDLRILSIERMVAISDKWLRLPQAKVLAQFPETAVLVPKLQGAHDALFVLAAPAEVSRELKALFERQKRGDVRHDDLVVATHDILTSLARRETDAVARDRYLKLRDYLFPNGIGIVKLPYEEEGGAALLLFGRLKEEHQAQLKEIPLPGGATLLDDVLSLIVQGKELLALNEEKKALLNAPNEGPTPADEQKAKVQWIRVVRGLETNLALAGAPEEVVKEFFRDLSEAVAAAERKLPVTAPEEEITTEE